MPGFDGTIACNIPDIPVARDDEWRLRIAQFGDGYSQRTLDGINALNMKWNLVWQNREKAVLQAMVDFLIAQKANAFQFKEPQTGVMYDVWCDTWHIEWVLRRKGASPATPLYWGTLTAEFVKANGITA
jgi:phage-related protein